MGVAVLAWVWLATQAQALEINVSPKDCDAKEGCGKALNDAVEKCRRASSSSCSIVLAPFGRYRVACPIYDGELAYIRTPGAVDLSNTSNVIFGAANIARPAFLDVDYIKNGCPGVAASHATNVKVQNIIIDCQRLPFTEATIDHVSDSGKYVALKMNEPNRSEFDTEKYPWLLRTFESAAKWFTGFTKGSYDADTGVAVLTFPSASPTRAHLTAGTAIFSKHYVNMQAWGVYGWMVKGKYSLEGVTLLTSAGMGLRCDFCKGDVLIRDSVVGPGAGRSMSTTADGIHFMHHSGSVTMRNTSVAGTGDDCFNVHGNFFIMSQYSADRRTATYIDETGPGWIPASPTYMIGDRVAFYSRLTLQQIGEENVLLGATGGFGPNATIAFQNPVPAGVKRYDMVLSLDRVSSFDAEDCTFRPGGRGMVVSATPVRIVNNRFIGLHCSSVLFLEGGCGAYEDYTEGPLSSDILIEGNTFDYSNGPITMRSATQGSAPVQIGGCRPVGTCGAPVPSPSPPASALPVAPAPTPFAPPCEINGSTIPPVETHSDDTGPGRITEPGIALTGGYKIYKNVTIRNNVFSMAPSTPYFIDVGATDGLEIKGNALVALGGDFGADMFLYSSSGYDSSRIEGENKCAIQNGSSTKVRPCHCNATTDSS